MVNATVLHSNRKNYVLILVIALAVFLLILALSLVCKHCCQEQESIRAFDSGGRTIGGPAIVTSSKCPSQPVEVFFGKTSICATVENIGDAPLALYLASPTHPLSTGSYFDISVGYSVAICSKTDSQVWIGCASGGASCKTNSCFRLRWRVDDGE